ncbi:hypothetical protein Hanom_Chr16g01509341 [Helianthus anomalus]
MLFVSFVLGCLIYAIMAFTTQDFFGREPLVLAYKFSDLHTLIS